MKTMRTLKVCPMSRYIKRYCRLTEDGVLGSKQLAS